jgi:hypothetical protein
MKRTAKNGAFSPSLFAKRKGKLFPASHPPSGDVTCGQVTGSAKNLYLNVLVQDTALNLLSVY